MRKITILTLNTQGILAFSFDYQKKCDAIALYCANQQVDIINFQEVFFYHHFLYLKKLLKDFPYCSYKPSLFGPEAGLVTFSRYPLKLSQYKNFKNLGNLWSKAIISILGKKGMLLSQIQNSDIYVLNAHFSPNFSNDWEYENQDTRVIKEQLHELHSFIAQRKGRYIITGDFNLHKKSYLYKLLLQKHINDVFRFVFKTTHRGDILIDSKGELQVDYILFIGKNIKVMDKNYIFEKQIEINNKKLFISDHVGLQATSALINRKRYKPRVSAT